MMTRRELWLAVTAITLPWLIVSVTLSVSVTAHGPLPEQLTGSVTVVPVTLAAPRCAEPVPPGPLPPPPFPEPATVSAIEAPHGELDGLLLESPP
jgi:hypothetical protein